MRTLPGLVLLAVLAGPALARAGEGTAPPGPQDAERLYRKRCASCHRLREPGERSAESWAEVMRRMGPRAHLSEPERAAVLRWLQARASDAAR